MCECLGTGSVGVMPRRTADQRHVDSEPAQRAWPPEGDDLVDALIALHHPTRRRLYELLELQGPAPVGTLAARAGLAPGSVSHHLKLLHRTGFVTPAPELARDTRESWWRAIRRSLSWDAADWPAGSAARNVAELAERANLSHAVRAIAAWRSTRDQLPEPWRTSGSTTDALVNATAEQLADLTERVASLLSSWSRDCLTDATKQPDAERRPVRVVAHVFPTEAL